MFLRSRDKILKASLSKNYCLKTGKESIQGNVKVESIDSLHQQIRELQGKLAAHDKKKSVQVANRKNVFIIIALILGLNAFLLYKFWRDSVDIPEDLLGIWKGDGDVLVINSDRKILLGTKEVYQGVIKKVENKYCLKVNQKLYFELVDDKLILTDQKSEKIFSKVASTE